MLSIIRLTAAMAALSLAACGGGGGSDKPASSSSATSQALSSSSSSPQASSSSTTSSVLSSSSSSSAANLVTVKINGTINGFDESGQSTPLDKSQVNVELVLLDANEQPLANAAPIASDYNNSTELRFSADLSATGATSLALYISAPGHTSYARKLPPESKINVDAKLQAVPVQTVVPGTATTASGVSLDGFNIQVSG
ncbi:MAG TPA: hypothetical protein VF433_09555, partial [Cellvibrio sp.]